jgi:hypothetical protein
LRKAATNYDCDLDFDDKDDGERKPLLRRLLGENPGARIGATGLVALSLAIVVNALLLQDQRHAAPLFQMSLRAPSAPLLEEQAPLPAPRPVELASLPQAKPIVANTGRADLIGREIARLEQQPARAEPVSRNEKSKAAEARPVETRTADVKKNDAIGGLIRNVRVTSAPTNEPDGSVMAAQRALMKLGFVLRPDGVFGGTTRQAIERFERDNRMPVHGELTARIKAELARQSGVEIE